jgi:hypothetical protein
MKLDPNAPTVTLEQALARTNHDFIWRATLRDGTVIFEQPGLSSDHLPRDEVIVMEYVPTRRPDFPVIECRVDLDKGERFVRYWSTVWRNNGGTQRIYVLGVERQKKFALLGFYPNFGKIVFAGKKPFSPSWAPNPFANIPEGASLRGGPGSPSFGWVHEGFGGVVVNHEKRLIFTSLYS